MKGNFIIVSTNTRGIFVNGIVDGTPKPGTIMQAKSVALSDNNQIEFEVYNRDADGNHPKGPLYILLEDQGQGFTYSRAYVDGEQCRCYIPAPGEEFNILLLDVAGTGDDHTLGEILMVDDGTGKLVATTGSPESEPFMLLETITDPTADTLAWVRYSGF